MEGPIRKRIQERMRMATTTVTDDSFEQDVLGSDKPVLVDFWAEWCAPCKRIAPTLEELSDELGDRIGIAKLDIVENPEVPGDLGVKSIPMLILFKGGRELARWTMGNAPKSVLQDWLESQLQESSTV
jgi:thioredoxin 1